MTSEDRPAPRVGGGSAGTKPASAAEETLKTERIQIERKSFVFSLKENPRGRFLRITEDVAGRRDTIIIPAPGLPEFKRVVDELVKISSEMPKAGRRSADL